MSEKRTFPGPLRPLVRFHIGQRRQPRITELGQFEHSHPHAEIVMMPRVVQLWRPCDIPNDGRGETRPIPTEGNRCFRRCYRRHYNPHNSSRLNDPLQAHIIHAWVSRPELFQGIATLSGSRAGSRQHRLKKQTALRLFARRMHPDKRDSLSEWTRAPTPDVRHQARDARVRPISQTRGDCMHMIARHHGDLWVIAQRIRNRGARNARAQSNLFQRHGAGAGLGERVHRLPSWQQPQSRIHL